MKIKFFTTGGTIDKVYFDKKSDYQVGEPITRKIIQEMNVAFEYEFESILKKDSLDLTDADRQFIFDTISSDEYQHIIVTHGTDTMIQTAQKLQMIPDKVIVLTGAIEPAGFKSSDAVFNIGTAIAAVQALPHGTYITMSGCIFKPDSVRKNLKTNRFEEA
jgi:L-asparaginase